MLKAIVTRKYRPQLCNFPTSHIWISLPATDDAHMLDLEHGIWSIWEFLFVSGYSDLLMTAPPPAMRLPRRISDFVKRRIRKIAREPGDALIG
jgi:hypothetical protein